MEIVRRTGIQVTGEGAREVHDNIIVEDRVRLFLNGEYITTLVTCLDRLEDLGAGFIICEGLADGVESVEVSGKDIHVTAPVTKDALLEVESSGGYRVLGEPTTCPHGNPIPGADYVPPPTRTLREVPVGSTFTISRIPEELEFEPGMLDFLEQHSLQPGRQGHLTVLSPDGTATVEMDGAHVGVPAFATQRILVTA